MNQIKEIQELERKLCAIQLPASPVKIYAAETVVDLAKFIEVNIRRAQHYIEKPIGRLYVERLKVFLSQLK